MGQRSTPRPNPQIYRRFCYLNHCGSVFQDTTDQMQVVKRVMQLTGKRISDPVIQQSKTAGELCSQLMIKPKPKKLVEALQNNKKLSNLSNVKFHERRVTSIDKETRIGRWKVIERELLDRDLPVTGRDLAPSVS